MNDNGQLLANAQTAIERLRADEAALAREIDTAQARLELTRELLDMLTGRATRRRRRTVAAVEPEAAAPQGEPEAPPEQAA